MNQNARWNSDIYYILLNKFHDFFYFVQKPTNAQLTDKLLYRSYMFRHYCVILSELKVSTLLSYTSMSMQWLVIQFKISHV